MKIARVALALAQWLEHAHSVYNRGLASSSPVFDINTQSTIVKSYLNNIFKLKSCVSVESPVTRFTLENSTNHDLEPIVLVYVLKELPETF